MGRPRTNTGELEKVKKRIIGLGEVLWDVFPDRVCLGGAPANFAYITTLLGDQGIVASRVGQDSNGREALHRLGDFGLNVDHVQQDAVHPTGTVQVQIDERGQARYEISRPVAWDFLEWTPDWEMLAGSADAVCFGSLAQRSQQSAATIQRFVKAVPSAAVRVFDVNLRQAFYSEEILQQSMSLADIVKLNDEELSRITSLMRLPHLDERSSAARLLKQYNLKLVCITRGNRGSLLVQGDEVDEHPGFRVPVADTVGSGDAFTAGLLHKYFRGASLCSINESANLVGAWVASEVGAMPSPEGGLLERSLAEVRNKARREPRA